MLNYEKTYYNLPLEKKDAIEIAASAINVPYKIVESKYIYETFGSNYIPGTFYFSERKYSPSFLFDENDLNYEEWIRSMTNSHIAAIEKYLSKNVIVCNFDKVKMQDAVLKVLDINLDSINGTLSSFITNQQITDIILRIIKSIIWGNSYYHCHVFESFNELGKYISIKILDRIITENPIEALKAAIVSGALGVNIKASYYASGPSPVINNAILQINTSQFEGSINNIVNKIKGRVNKKYAIEFYSDFEKNVLNSSTKFSLMIFTDDYIETIFDLWAIQKIFSTNPKIVIRLVPKWGQYANDASYKDIFNLLNLPCFTILRKQLNTRFFVDKFGPVGSGINPFEFSESIFNKLINCDMIIFRGARSFEMLQGIKKNVFFAFNVLRSYTESLTGIDAEEGQSVFIKQMGVPSFEDFRYRSQRKTKSIYGRIVGLAKMTALEYAQAISSKQYSDLIHKYNCSEKEINCKILINAQKQDMTFSQYILQDKNDSI